ncbi:hypothetical protein DL346_09770 [Paenibacillus montanisoli]|uniref:Aminoglycoside phosphotransferase domain-containing protein n=2 Tax=Paenibacillus montanisoli TaxID=2081970 RepID=A0A328U2F7_9BACL|nr:hypothetical protein DL346_09770 [Paenibacillus montanisoli]
MGSLSEWAPVAEGEESQAFSIRFGEDECILRVNRSAEGFRQDDFCYRHFSSRDLPIPEIVNIGELDGEYAYCVSRRAPGVTLQDLPFSDLPSVTGPVMRVMESIAGTNIAGTKGFGPFDENGIGRFANWRDFIMNITNSSQYDWGAVKLLIVDQRIESYFRAVEAFAPRCPEVRQLVHGDFGSNNVLTDDGLITGVIDWSEAMFGDPLYDVANIFFWRSWLDCMEVQARHIEKQHPEIAHHAEALRCYKLRIGLDLIYQSAAARELQLLAWAMARCDEIIKEKEPS